MEGATGPEGKGLFPALVLLTGLLNKADVVIVGAGVHGASLAFNLLRMEAGKIVIVEKANVGAGATGRSASFIRHHYSNEICVEIVKESRRIFASFEEEVGIPVDFQPQPLLLLAGPEHEEALKHNVAMHRRLGVDVQTMVPAEARGAYPYLDLEGITLAALERDAGYGDAYEVNMAYATEVKEMGGTVLTDTEVLSIRVRSGKARGVVTTRGSIEADVVVLAAGPWSSKLGKTAGIDVPVEPALLSLGVLLPPGDVRESPMAFDMTTATYWRPERSGTLLVGTDEEVGGTWDPDGLPEGVSFDFVSAVSERLGQRWPEMKDAHFVRGWVGADGATPDMHPIIGPAPTVDGLYLATGFSGHGFKFGPAVGKCLAELITDGSYRTLDLTPFGLERFALGRTFKSRYPMAVVQ
ncbi:MAG: NAD(P)/FAD-dependent oxidoreductase [Thermoplasmata archaeon]